MENILNCLDSFVRENSLTSVIIISFTLSFIYDLLKKIFFSIVKYSIKKTNRWSLRNINFLIKHYKSELTSLKKISKNNNGELIKVIEETFNYLLFGLTLTIFLLFIKMTNNNLFFYGSLGASSLLIIKMIRNLIYNYRLIQKSKKVEYHENKIKNKIKNLKELIKKIKVE